MACTIPSPRSSATFFRLHFGLFVLLRGGIAHQRAHTTLIERNDFESRSGFKEYTFPFCIRIYITPAMASVIYVQRNRFRRDVASRSLCFPQVRASIQYALPLCFVSISSHFASECMASSHRNCWQIKCTNAVAATINYCWAGMMCAANYRHTHSFVFCAEICILTRDINADFLCSSFLSYI